MDLPVFLAILSAIVSQLKRAGVAGGRVARVHPPESAASSAAGSVIVTPTRAVPQPAAIRGAPVDWDTGIRIDVESRFGVGNQEPDEVVTLLAAEVWAALFGDESLGGVADGMLPGIIDWNFADPERQIARVSMFLTVLHRTNYGVLTS